MSIPATNVAGKIISCDKTRRFICDKVRSWVSEKEEDDDGVCREVGSDALLFLFLLPPRGDVVGEGRWDGEREEEIEGVVEKLKVGDDSELA